MFDAFDVIEFCRRICGLRDCYIDGKSLERLDNQWACAIDPACGQNGGKLAMLVFAYLWTETKLGC